MIRFFTNYWLLVCLRVAIGILFVYAGFTKFAAPLPFAESISSFQILPNASVNVLALGLPPTEILIGLLMVFGFRYRAATLCILVMTAIFALALGQAIARGIQVDCGCFGSDQPSVTKMWLSLGRDVLIFGGSLWIYVTSFREKDKRQLARY